MKIFKSLEKAAALLAVFFLPSQLALHFWPPESFVFGIRIDYLSPAVYLTDILILCLLAFSFINSRKIFQNFVRKHLFPVIVLLFLILINLIFSTNPSISFFKWTKILEYVFFGIYIFINKEFLGERNTAKIFLSSSVLISLIGIMQFFLRHTTGLFYLLGERSFYWGTPGIALVTIRGASFLRAYSILPHPNALAGYLGVSILFILFSKILKKKIIWYLSLLILLFGFVLTFSLSAFIAFGILILVLIFNKTKIFTTKLLVNFLYVSVIASLILPVYSERILQSIKLPENISQRVELSYISGSMMGDSFLIGKGLNTFIMNSVAYKGSSVFQWLLQPVHNIFLLTVTETGIAGLIILVFFIYNSINFFAEQKNYPLLAVIFFVIFTGLSDHYWLTIQQNMLLLAFIFGFSYTPRSN